MRTLLKNGFCLRPFQPEFQLKDVLIEANRILQAEEDIKGLPEDLVMDLEGCYVLPGLIEMHAHLCRNGSSDPTEWVPLRKGSWRIC